MKTLTIKNSLINFVVFEQIFHAIWSESSRLKCFPQCLLSRKAKILAIILCTIPNLYFTSPADAQMITLYAGTPISLTLNQTVNSEEVEVGHVVEFLVRSDVTVNGQVLIKTGTIAEGWVKDVTKTCQGRCNRRCSEVVITVESVQAVDGQRIYLRSIPCTIKGDCSRNAPAIAKLGTVVSARVLNNIKIMI